MYSATNLRTKGSWLLANSQHMCGGPNCGLGRNETGYPSSAIAKATATTVTNNVAARKLLRGNATVTLLALPQYRSRFRPGACFSPCVEERWHEPLR